jgi:ribosomal protein S6
VGPAQARVRDRQEGRGNYHLLHFDADAETLAEVTRVLKITDGAMRHMAVRRPAAQPRRTEAVQPAG